MATLIAPEAAAERESLLHSSPAPPPKVLQRLLQETLSVLTHWYSGHGGDEAPGKRDDAGRDREQEGEEGEIPLVHLQSPSPTPRLHSSAESCLSSLRAGTASISTSGSSPDFLHLPVGVHLHIFSFLDAPTLCRLAQTCGYMHNLTSDPLLWTRLLERDVQRWNVIGHLSHPQVYHEASSDLSPKQIYCRCLCHRDERPRQSFAHPITRRLRSLVRKMQGHIPRLLMFGSGLESVPLVRSMLWENGSPYHPIGLYPGKDGVGSGVCIQHRDTAVNLITLYTATRAEREAASAGRQARVNKLLSAAVSGGQTGGGEGELTPALQQLCRQSDAAILVVDASHFNKHTVKLDTLMLQSVLSANNLQTTPLLVLSCQPRETNNNSGVCHSVMEVANGLQLCDLHQPWQVRALVLDQYQSLQAGMDWLLGAANL